MVLCQSKPCLGDSTNELTEPKTEDHLQVGDIIAVTSTFKDALYDFIKETSNELLSAGVSTMLGSFADTLASQGPGKYRPAVIMTINDTNDLTVCFMLTVSGSPDISLFPELLKHLIVPIYPPIPCIPCIPQFPHLHTSPPWNPEKVSPQWIAVCPWRLPPSHNLHHWGNRHSLPESSSYHRIDDDALFDLNELAVERRQEWMVMGENVQLKWAKEYEVSNSYISP